MANSNATWLGITGIAQFKEMGSILHKDMVQIALANTNRCEKGWKWVKLGEFQKCCIPNVAKASKPTQQGNDDAPMISKHGSPVRPDAQIVAMRAHCA